MRFLPAVYWNPAFCHPLPQDHRFPMQKYQLIPERLAVEGLIDHRSLKTPEAIDESYILLAHESKFWQRLSNAKLSSGEIRRIGFPMSPELVWRERLIAGASLQGAIDALQYGIAFNTAGGTHHAGPSHSEGYCLLNDAAIAALGVLHLQLCKKVLIADLDVHQGNGTAEICRSHPNIFTFSMHAKKAYPLRKQDSDLDISLEPETNDQTYLQLLTAALLQIEQRFLPDLVIFNAGVDVLATDALGGLKLSMQGCEARDSTLFSWCSERKIPVLCVMGGGYSSDLHTVVDAHIQTYRSALRIFA